MTLNDYRPDDWADFTLILQGEHTDVWANWADRVVCLCTTLADPWWETASPTFIGGEKAAAILGMNPARLAEVVA